MTQRVKLEVCVDSVESALAAVAGGAARLELCSTLEIGGTTPSAGLIKLVRAKIALPLHVLIRPRGGGFCYSQYELSVMERDIAMAKAQGADGIVCGALQANGRVDMAAMRRIIELARPLRFTFHRAFDVAIDPYLALEDIIALGANYLLTSGQQEKVSDGLPLLVKLVKQAAKRIEIMPGGGISEDNVHAVAEATGVSYVHASARSFCEDNSEARMLWSETGYRQAHCSTARVAEIIKAANTH